MYGNSAMGRGIQSHVTTLIDRLTVILFKNLYAFLIVQPKTVEAKASAV